MKPWLNTPRKPQVYGCTRKRGTGDPCRLIWHAFFEKIFLCFYIFKVMLFISILIFISFFFLCFSSTSSPLGIAKGTLWDGTKSQKTCHICKTLISSIVFQGMLLHNNQGYEEFSCWVNSSLLWWSKEKIIVILRVSNTTMPHHMLRWKLSKSARGGLLLGS